MAKNKDKAKTAGEVEGLRDRIAIAPDQRATASVIANFRQVVKEGSLKLHPLITRLIDPETLEKMGATRDSSGAEAGSAAVPEGEIVN